MVSTEDKVVIVVVDVLGIRLEEACLRANLVDDLGADPLDILEIVCAIENILGIEISDEDVKAFKTVGDLVKYAEQHT